VAIMREPSADPERPGRPGHDSTAAGPDVVRLTVWLSGRVQGVGMRWWVRARALELGLAGSASNLRDGRVEIVAEGARPAVETLLDLLAVPAAAAPAGRPGRISGVVERWDQPHGGLEGFRER
jgi:acylphosphatase